ncbi:MAG: hypothetical protein HY666_05025 [Chloroflexi bacterium]|nr:hypothetical protein [Chloroflexota bacterium]
MTTNQTLLQMNIPDEFRGRITSIYMLDQGLLPLGTFIAGVGADMLGAPRMVAVMGLNCASLAVIIFLRSASCAEHEVNWSGVHAP